MENGNWSETNVSFVTCRNPPQLKHSLQYNCSKISYNEGCYHIHFLKNNSFGMKTLKTKQ